MLKKKEIYNIKIVQYLSISTAWNYVIYNKNKKNTHLIILFQILNENIDETYI